MLRHTGMCCPNGLLFHQKSLDMGPSLVKKSVEEGPISQKLQKNRKISHFVVAKPFDMGPNLQKFCKNHKISRFLGEKNLKAWLGVSDLGLHTPSKNNLSTPLDINGTLKALHVLHNPSSVL